MSSAALLRLDGITKSWGNQTVLSRVGLEVPPRAVVRIAGRNGAGKTTLLRIVVGLVRPDSGGVAIRGLHPELDRGEYLAQIGFLSTGDRGLYARLSARRHLDLCADLAMLRPP